MVVLGGAAACSLLLGAGLNSGLLGDASSLVADSNSAAKVIFQKSCASCHAGGGNSVPFYGQADLSLASLKRNGYLEDDGAKIGAIVKNGKGIMPKFQEGPQALSDEEIQDLTAVTDKSIDLLTPQFSKPRASRFITALMQECNVFQTQPEECTRCASCKHTGARLNAQPQGRSFGHFSAIEKRFAMKFGGLRKSKS